MKTPVPGKIYSVDLGQSYGKEYPGGKRPVLVVSLETFNELSPPLVVPIDPTGEQPSRKGFTILLEGCSKTQGVILCNQVRTCDLDVRGAKYIETAPTKIVEDVIEKIFSFLVKPLVPPRT